MTLSLQPAEQFWKLYELFHIRDIEFDGVYLQGMLRQVPAWPSLT